MEIYVLSGAAVSTPEQLQDALQAALPLPPHYGRNLDALHDILTEWRQDFTLQITDCDGMLSRLGLYGVNLMRAISDAAEENPHLIVDLE